MKKSKRGIGFLDVLLVVLVVLKLFGLITTSWVWVLSPIWIPLCIILFLLGMAKLCELISKNINK